MWIRRIGRISRFLGVFVGNEDGIGHDILNGLIVEWKIMDLIVLIVAGIAQELVLCRKE